MKKVSLLSIFIFLVLDPIFAVTYDNLYVVGNACSADNESISVGLRLLYVRRSFLAGKFITKFSNGIASLLEESL